MKVLMISTDRKIFEENSAVRQRILEYGGLVEELKIIIFNSSTRVSSSKYQVTRLSNSNVWLYPTNSKNKFFYIFDAIRIGRGIIGNWKLGLGNSSDKNKILVTCQDPFETGFVGWVIAKTKKTKLHLQIHTDFLSWHFKMASVFNKTRSQLAIFLIMQANGVRVVSERIKNSITKWKLKKADKISVLPIFVDIERIKNTEPKFDLHKKYSQFDFIIFTASRFEKEKNILMAIDVMKKIVKEHPKVGLVIIGSGSQERKLKLLTTHYSLQTNIVFEEWNDDLVSYYKTADLFLATSNYEGYGMTLLESAVAGCPILTTDVGLVKDILKEGSVEVCKVGDEKCFVKKLENILGNKNILKTMSENAKRDVENRVIKNKEDYLREYKRDWERCFE
ncbi:glycosyltransferase family 4 protein [Patescibacteria group bacterium]|nr:glycosyltransferase family 4 protein [Patescibacteria group bacterium]